MKGNRLNVKETIKEEIDINKQMRKYRPKIKNNYKIKK